METTLNHNNIYERFKQLQSHFESVIKGYHMINKSPIKESVWEEVNCDIVSNICSVTDEAKGNHMSGKDNRFDEFNISNKTGKESGEKISISSYRLTSVCSDKSPGNEKEIINEIKKRDESFDYYSFLIRNEDNISKIKYEWYVIPKTHNIFKIDKLNFMYGKKGKKKGEIIGWESTFCDITFSMSSQLWYKFEKKHILDYKMCEVEIDNSKPKLNYSIIYNSLNHI